MTSKRLTKHQTVAMQLLFGGLFACALAALLVVLYASRANAADTPGTGSVSIASLFNSGNNCAGSTSTTTDIRCCNAASKLEAASSNLAIYCGSNSTAALTSCMTKQAACTDADSSFMSSDDSDTTSDDTTTSNVCTRIVNTGCPQANAGKYGDYKDEKKDAQDTFKQDQKDLNDLTSKQQDIGAKTADTVQKLQAALQAAGVALQDFEEKTDLKLKNDLLSENQQKAAAVIAARTKMDALDAQLVDLSDAANQAHSAVIEATNDVTAQCRTYAQGAYQSDLDKINAKITQTDSQIRNLGSGTGMASYTNQITTDRSKAKQQSYSGHYNGCLQGVEGPGQEAKNKVTKAQQDEKNALAKQAQQKVLIAKQRVNAMADLTTAEAQLSDQGKLATQVAQQAINDKERQYALLQTTTQQQIQTAEQQAAQQSQQLTTQINQMQQSLAQSGADLQTSSLRMSCAQKYGGQMPSSQATTSLQNWAKAPGEIDAITTSCSTLSSCSVDNYGSYKSKCDSLTKAAAAASRARADAASK